MANYDCAACEELRTSAPSLVVNGFDDTMCTSLKNNTGLVPSSGHDDCTDLDAMNDCLVGNMGAEVKLYDVCDWKTYMKKFVPNVWTVIKGIICSICGLWARVTDIESRNAETCELLDQVMNPALKAYGILPLADTDASKARRCGTATSKVVKRPDDGTLNAYIKANQNIGIAYAQMTRKSCTSDRQEMIEWIAPSHFYYKLASGASVGDVLWKITKEEAQSVIGISDYLWQIYTESSWTWHESALNSSRQLAWIKLAVGTNGLSSNEMGIIFMGCTAPNNAITSDDEIASFNNASARVVRHYL